MYRIHRNKIFSFGLKVSCTAFGILALQGIAARKDYMKNIIDPPNGPTFGIEIFNETKHKFLNKLNLLQDEVKLRKEILMSDIEQKELELKEKIEKSFQDWKDKIRHKKELFLEKKDEILSSLVNPSSKNTITSLDDVPKIDITKKVKLLLIGDSLACGVGCEHETGVNSSPELPRVLAKTLSYALQQEVQWCSAGIVGATTDEIRKKVLVDVISGENLSRLVEKNSDNDVLIVVVLCGFNDLKTSFQKFPYIDGASNFKTNLKLLTDDIKQWSTTKFSECQIFFPAIPMKCSTSDPAFSFKSPLKDLIVYLSWIWDNQKKKLAQDDIQRNVWFIREPELNSKYGTAGHGNVSSDKVHPSIQGYQWWGLHIASEIISILGEKL